MQGEEAFHRTQTPFSGPQNEEEHHKGDRTAHTTVDHGAFVCDNK